MNQKERIEYWADFIHSDASHDDVMVHTYELFPELRAQELTSHE